MNMPDAARLREICAESNTELRLLANTGDLDAFLREALGDPAADTPPTAILLDDGRAFTLADALIARTGSIALSGRFPAARRAAFLAETHYALLPAENIYADLGDYLAAAASSGWRDRVGHQLTLITGPSRTADIEKTLVLGAHGPRRLVLALAPATLLRERWGSAMIAPVPVTVAGTTVDATTEPRIPDLDKETEE